MIDTEFEKRGRAMSEKLNTIQPIDTEYLPVTRANVNHLAVLLQQSQDEVAQLRAALEKIRVALRGYSDSDLVSLAEATQTRLTAAEFILATLCDMVLCEGAKDRSDSALVRAVGALKRERDFQRQQVKDLSVTAEYYRKLTQEARDERDVLKVGRLCKQHQIEFDAMTISEKVAKYKECVGHVIDERAAAIADARTMASLMDANFEFLTVKEKQLIEKYLSK